MAEAKTGEEPDRQEPVTLSAPTATDHERELALQASQEFEQAAYDPCLTTLTKLANSRGQDPKVMHNRAVVEYYKSNFTKTDEFLKALADVCSKARVNLENIACVDDAEQCVMYFNQAIILYHLRQYKQALVIVDKLFQFVEPMDDHLSRRVMILSVELYLCTHQPEKAMGMLAFMEKSLFGNGKSSQSDKDVGGGAKEAASGAKEAGGGAKEGKDKPQDTAANEALRPRISQYKARCYMMLKSLKSCKREMKGLMNHTTTSSAVAYLKANFEHLRGNCRKAVKVLNSAPQLPRPAAETGECVPMMYYNDVAILHFHMRKHNLGAFYFRKAVTENMLAAREFNRVDASKSLSGRPVQTLSVSRHYELLYNMGLQLLHCGKPEAAFDCLVETVQLYQVNPRLWLRLAECCIIKHRDSNDEDRKLSQKSEVIQGSVGSGVHRKLILGPGLNRQPSSTESSVVPNPTLEFASLCLRNALMLLPHDPLLTNQPPPDEDGESRAGIDIVLVAAPPGNPMRASEVANLRCSVLAGSAYVSMCLNDHLVALQHAEQLLKQPRLSGAHRYLANMYLGEAMVALDRIADAVGHLNPDNINEVATTFPEHKQEQEKGEKNGDKEPSDQGAEVKGALYPWAPRDLMRAKAIMQYNLATAHAIRGEYEKATFHLSKSTQTIGFPLPAQMYFLKLYLELMEGRRKTAQGIIKEHFGHMTPNRV